MIQKLHPFEHSLSDDQRSINKLEQVTVGPVSEAVFEAEHINNIISKLESGLSKSLKKIKDDKVKEQLVETIGYELEQLKQGNKPDQIFKYLSLAYQNPASLIDYLPKNGMVVLDEISRIQELNDSLEKEEAEWYTDLISQGRIIHDVEFAHNLPELIARSTSPIIYLSLFLRHVPHTNPQNILNMACKQMQNFHGQMNVLRAELERWKKGKYTVIILGQNEDRVKKVHDVLSDYEIDADEIKDSSNLIPGRVQILQGSLNSGFEMTMQKFVIITETELFNKRAKKSIRRQKLSNAERIKSYSELKVGDYVVHVNHGIGKYLGIETLRLMVSIRIIFISVIKAMINYMCLLTKLILSRSMLVQKEKSQSFINLVAVSGKS